MISSSAKMPRKSSGPAGSFVAGFSGGSGSPGRSGAMLIQWVGILSSVSRYFVVSSDISLVRLLGNR